MIRSMQKKSFYALPVLDLDMGSEGFAYENSIRINTVFVCLFASVTVKERR